MIYRSVACASLFAVSILAAAPASAQTGTMKMDCSEATMMKANADAMKMTDATKKAAAMKEMEMAKDMMAKKDEKGCMTHMEKAMGMMK